MPTQPGRKCDITGRAFLAATLADSVRLADRLAEIARNRGRRAHVRDRALRWLPEVADREGTAAEADGAMQAIAGDQGDVLLVRERAIRQLPPTPDNDAFLRRLYGRLAETTLKERTIRRLGESWSEENTRWMRALALDGGEPLGVRDRAIRVLGEEQDQPEQLRALYAELADITLKERVVRVAAEQADPETFRWLRTIAEDRTEHSTLRDRALRSWAESGGSTEELIGLYDTSRSRTLQERLVRLLAERGDDEAVDKLIAIARSDPDTELRRLALRRLSESGHDKARSFLQETVRR